MPETPSTQSSAMGPMKWGAMLPTVHPRVQSKGHINISY